VFLLRRLRSFKASRSGAGFSQRRGEEKSRLVRFLQKRRMINRMDETRRKQIERRRGPLAAPLFAMAVLFPFALVLASVMATARAAEQTPRFFRIGTAAISGTYFVIGAEIANAISKPPGSRDCARGGSCGVEGLVAVAQATQGSIANAVAVGSGQLDAAFIQADIAGWAFSGKGPVTKSCRGSTALPENGLAVLAKMGPLRNLRAVAALYPEAIHIVTRADAKLRGIADLKGKRVALGEPGSGTLAEARLVLDGVGLSECVLKAQYARLSETVGLLEKDGIDGFFMIGGYPVPAITDVASMEPVGLLPIAGATRDRLVKQYGFIPSTIPGGTYPSVDTETATVAVPALFIVSAALSDDLVYGITKALWQDSTRRLLDNGHPAGKRIRIEDALSGLSLPLHAGAARYYQEVGLKLPETGAAN
jgi:TRAP transporter TAXI family solute receptor